MTPDARLLTVALWALCATPAAGQVVRVDGWSLGFTSSARETVYPGGGSGSSSSDRRLVAVGVSSRLYELGPVTLESGLRLTPKGFETTEPTWQAEYLEVPLAASVGTPWSVGPYVTGGVLVGVRVHCRRWARRSEGRVDDACGDSPPPLDWGALSRWDLSWELGAGLRLRGEDEGAFWIGARFARSFVDVEPARSGKSRNRVVTFGMGFDFPVG